MSKLPQEPTERMPTVPTASESSPGGGRRQSFHKGISQYFDRSEGSGHIPSGLPPRPSSHRPPARPPTARPVGTPATSDVDNKDGDDRRGDDDMSLMSSSTDIYIEKASLEVVPTRSYEAAAALGDRAALVDAVRKVTSGDIGGRVEGGGGTPRRKTLAGAEVEAAEEADGSEFPQSEVSDEGSIDILDEEDTSFDAADGKYLDILPPPLLEEECFEGEISSTPKGSAVRIRSSSHETASLQSFPPPDAASADFSDNGRESGRVRTPASDSLSDRGSGGVFHRVRQPQLSHLHASAPVLSLKDCASFHSTAADGTEIHTFKVFDHGGQIWTPNGSEILNEDNGENYDDEEEEQQGGHTVGEIMSKEGDVAGMGKNPLSWCSLLDVNDAAAAVTASRLLKKASAEDVEGVPAASTESDMGGDGNTAPSKGVAYPLYAKGGIPAANTATSNDGREPTVVSLAPSAPDGESALGSLEYVLRRVGALTAPLSELRDAGRQRGRKDLLLGSAGDPIPSAGGRGGDGFCPGESSGSFNNTNTTPVPRTQSGSDIVTVEKLTATVAPAPMMLRSKSHAVESFPGPAIAAGPRFAPGRFLGGMLRRAPPSGISDALSGSRRSLNPFAAVQRKDSDGGPATKGEDAAERRRRFLGEKVLSDLSAATVDESQHDAECDDGLYEDEEAVALHSIFSKFCFPAPTLGSVWRILELERGRVRRERRRRDSDSDESDEGVTLPRDITIIIQGTKKSRGSDQASAVAQLLYASPPEDNFLALPLPFQMAFLRILVRLLADETDNEYDNECLYRYFEEMERAVEEEEEGADDTAEGDNDEHGCAAFEREDGIDGDGVFTGGGLVCEKSSVGSDDDGSSGSDESGMLVGWGKGGRLA